jgi:hypothetical protein
MKKTVMLCFSKKTCNSSENQPNLTEFNNNDRNPKNDYRNHKSLSDLLKKDDQSDLLEIRPKKRIET